MSGYQPIRHRAATDAGDHRGRQGGDPRRRGRPHRTSLLVSQAVSAMDLAEPVHEPVETGPFATKPWAKAIAIGAVALFALRLRGVSNSQLGGYARSAPAGSYRPEDGVKAWGARDHRWPS